MMSSTHEVQMCLIKKESWAVQNGEHQLSLSIQTDTTIILKKILKRKEKLIGYVIHIFFPMFSLIFKILFKWTEMTMAISAWKQKSELNNQRAAKPHSFPRQSWTQH